MTPCLQGKLFALTVVACATTHSASPPNAQGPNADLIADRLRTEWTRRFRVTTIDQAAAMTGIEFSDELRRAVRQRLASYHPDRGGERTRYTWRDDIYALTNDERLVAKWAMLKVPDRPFSGSATATALGLSEATAARALAFLTEIGFLVRADDAWRLGRDWRRQTLGLGLNFHEVLTAGERFNVQ